MGPDQMFDSSQTDIIISDSKIMNISPLEGETMAGEILSIEQRSLL
jgi:hypothetical protein